jgi:hypothetical protein
MSKSPKKRDKKYKGPGLMTDPLTRAVVTSSFIPDAYREGIMRPLYIACDCLRFELAVADDWNLLSDAMNHAVNLIELGICTDDDSRRIIGMGYLTLGKVAKRWHKWGKLQATDAEADALIEACERHEIQLLFTTGREMAEVISSLELHKAECRASNDAVNLVTSGVAA